MLNKIALSLCFVVAVNATNLQDTESDLAGRGERCKGLNEITGEPYPDCEDGLTCATINGLVSIPGAGFRCGNVELLETLEDLLGFDLDISVC